MDMEKCCVVVIHRGDDGPPDAMTPQMMHALVKARETHIRYRTYLGTLVVQLIVALWFAGSSSPTNILLGVLGASMLSAASYGFVARLWRRRFEKLASG